MHRLAALLVAAVIAAHAADPVADLLARTQEQYWTAPSFHIAATYRCAPEGHNGPFIHIVWDSQGEKYLRLTLSGIRLDRGYFDTGDDSGRHGPSVINYADPVSWSVRVVADGAALWTEYPRQHRYESRALTSFRGDWTADSAYQMLIGRYSRLSARSGSARIVESTGCCTVVETTDPADRVRHRYWIDRRAYLVRKEDVHSKTGRWSLTYGVVQPGGTATQAMFQFKPGGRSRPGPGRQSFFLGTPVPDYR